MINTNSLGILGQFYFNIKESFKSIYQNSNFYEKKISKTYNYNFEYKPSPHLLSSIIKYQNKKYKIEDFAIDSIWQNKLNPKDYEKLNNFFWFFSLDLKSSKQNVQSISFTSEDKPVVKTDLKSYNFDKAVIACGAFSKKLTDQVDEKIPLDTERGYHVHFKGHDHLLTRPVIFLNRGFGITPMEQGLRVVGTVEFGGLDNPPSKKRILNLVNNAKYLFPDLKQHHDEWLGFRPTLPDFLPVIGPSKNNKNLFYSFGHHHLGWTLGAISGKIISGMIAEENTNLNLSPYSSLRFS